MSVFELQHRQNWIFFVVINECFSNGRQNKHFHTLLNTAGPLLVSRKKALMDRCVSLIRTGLGSQLLTADTPDTVTSPFMSVI